MGEPRELSRSPNGKFQVDAGIGWIALTVAVLSLALNLLLTGVFIIAVRKLIGVNY